MHRQYLKARHAFPKSADEHAQPVVRLLRHKRADMDAKWEKLEEGWKENNELMERSALTARSAEDSLISLNVGGSNVTVWWHLLAAAEGVEDSILGAFLEGVWAEGRIPRDANGCIVLDESPACIKHLLHRMLISGGANSVAEGLPERAARSAVAIDEVPCLIYTSHAMGLPGYVPAHPKYAKVHGGSTILEPFEIAPFSAKVREWVGGRTEELALIYRATRDGFCDSEPFEYGCNEDSLHTVSLIRVSSGEGNDDDDSVVGAYSVIPCRGTRTEFSVSAESFVFMLKDGSATRKSPSKPTKWNPRPSMVDSRLSTIWGHCDLDRIDLQARFNEETKVCTVETGRMVCDMEEDSPFLALNGKTVVDIEVYLYSTPAPPTTTAPSTTTEPGGDTLAEVEAQDTHSFGKSIASSLIEERVVLDRAVKEKEAAGARVSAAVGALETVYGPSVAAGEQDAVVELNVRGTRMTTLRSTLQACPHSALAAIDRWPATGKDMDEHGARLVDCNPTCFAKILDVLRMRKRASWSRGAAGGKQEEGGGEEEESGGVLPGGVLIKEADLEVFGVAVNMYFPGCESFIMDLVHLVPSWCSPK